MKVAILECKIPGRVIRAVVKGVLFWGENADGKCDMEIKIDHNAKLEDIVHFRALWK